MNQQIKELVEQADAYANEQNELYGVDFKTAYNEKFAELIVRECADICYNREYTDGSRYGDEIIEHFGVK